MRDELWFIEFGRGAALPLTPEEAPADGEPVVPCAQGRVIVETTRPAPPHFATCSTYRRPLVSGGTANDISTGFPGTSSSATQTDHHYHQPGPASSCGRGAISKNIGQGGLAARPDDLGVTPWYLDDYPAADTSPSATGDRSSYPSYFYAEKEGRPELMSTRNSSVESEVPRPQSISHRKAYMDLRDAIALLDETCPNQEPSPSLTPRTPRTPQTPYPRNKRARSKSSDNSSNYSNERLSDRSLETTRAQEKEKKRPFLKKIGISKTEDRPFLAKLAPKIIGKPYLEKIGPSKAVEKPFLDKIGSSKTLDKFIFDTPRYERRTGKGEGERSVSKEDAKKSSQEVIDEKPERIAVCEKKFATERRRSGKGYLLKMYSFETEDLDSAVQPKDHRDPLRGSSFDDVLDSGPSSLPPMETAEEDQPATKPDVEQRPTSMAELLKCRVTTSEEIIYSSGGHGSPREANSWGNSPMRKRQTKKETGTPRSPMYRREEQNSAEGLRSDESTPNSPTKRPISRMSPDRQQVEEQTRAVVYSPAKTRRQTFEDILERNGMDEADIKAGRQAQFERRGISSDNLLSRDTAPSFALLGHQRGDLAERTREAASEDSLANRGAKEYTKETFKQLQDKFKYHEVPTETYADFKRRTKGNLHGTIGRQVRVKAGIVPPDGQQVLKDLKQKQDEPPTSKDTKEPAKSEEEQSSNGVGEVKRNQGTVRSVLRKQERVEQPNDQDIDTNESIRRPKRRIFHEPSQETMDLLTELRKVKSLLKTPSWEKDLELDKKPVRMPKRILLTDKEFCLSVERENSIRRPSRSVNTLDRTETEASSSDQQKPGENSAKEEAVQEEGKEEKTEVHVLGPALFEKKCLSLDYADEEKPQKPETRAISLAPARNLPSEVEENDYPDLGLVYDSKSCSSDVFNTPSEETNGKERVVIDTKEPNDSKTSRNHCTEVVDIAIPIDQRVTGSPKGRAPVQGRTSDIYEIISPRSTPFRAKKRLGKISVEETVKPESFTLGSKVDCRSAVAQKRTKCFPL